MDAGAGWNPFLTIEQCTNLRLFRNDTFYVLHKFVWAYHGVVRIKIISFIEWLYCKRLCYVLEAL
ncbi:MAG: hypothetical protein OXC91_08600 [Rhodobacteraceae bacterium]|nr:hypothetical protein [Paracoccaceae bacterium]